MKMINTIVAATLALTSSFAVNAENIAVTGATAHTMGAAGQVENATVLISEGKIVSVTSGGPVPSGFRTIDATGKIVTPGLMVSGTSLGLVEVSMSAGLNDSRYSSKAKVKMDLKMPVALNPDVTLIPVTRIEGITRAVTGFTTASPYGAGGGVIHLNGVDMVSNGHSYVTLAITDYSAKNAGGNRATLWQTITSKMDAANKPSEKDKDGKAKKAKPDADRDILKKVLSGDLALLVEANRAADIRLAIKLKAKYGLKRVILEGGAEAWRVADELAKADISVVLSGLASLPSSFERLGTTMTNAARLNAAGVTIAFIGDGSHNARLMVQHAGNAVAMGLPWDAAMKAMTVNPAKMFGIGDSYGSITAGFDADVVVWDGDPIEISSSPTAVIIRGDQIELVSRQTKLRDRYKKLTAHPAFVK